MQRTGWWLGLAVVIFGGALGVGLIWIGSGMANVTDVTRYSWAIGKLRGEGIFNSCPALFQLLPNTIPPNASQSTLLYRPGFGQGGTQFEVRYCLPAADRAAVEAAWNQSQDLQAGPSPYFTGWPDASFSKTTRTYTWKPGAPGAPDFKSPNPELTGINFECAIDDTSGQVGYRVDVLK